MNQTIPLIGQQDQAVGALRLQLAAGMLAQLAAVDFAQTLRDHQDRVDAYAKEDEEMKLRTGLVAGAAVAYADSLLLALGIVRQG